MVLPLGLGRAAGQPALGDRRASLRSAKEGAGVEGGGAEAAEQA